MAFAQWSHVGENNDVNLRVMNTDCTQIVGLAGSDTTPSNSNLHIFEVGPPDPGVIEGDYDSSGFVSQGDLDLVLLSWGDTVAPPGFNEDALPGGGPFDGLMSQNELDGVLLNWGNGTPPIGAVPEPTTFIMATLAAVALVSRRR